MGAARHEPMTHHTLSSTEKGKTNASDDDHVYTLPHDHRHEGFVWLAACEPHVNCQVRPRLDSPTFLKKNIIHLIFFLFILFTPLTKHAPQRELHCFFKLQCIFRQSKRKIFEDAYRIVRSLLVESRPRGARMPVYIQGSPNFFSKRTVPREVAEPGILGRRANQYERYHIVLRRCVSLILCLYMLLLFITGKKSHF